ncbi:MAG: M50 family metallopeptidase [Oscillospiraceae bacterium]|nr:M50 family metallopeptidase [Oscillospiraceae bacterium]
MSNQNSLKKIRIDVSGGFLVFIAGAYVLAGKKAFFAASAAVLAHETGHLLAMLLTGGEPTGIRMEAHGLRIDADSHGSPIISAAAGPAAGLLFAALARGETGRVSLALSLFNLLPYSKLDGGRMLSGRISQRAGTVLDCVSVLIMLAFGLFSRGAAAAGFWLLVDFAFGLL